jgi:hypothetical protein
VSVFLRFISSLRVYVPSNVHYWCIFQGGYTQLADLQNIFRIWQYADVLISDVRLFQIVVFVLVVIWRVVLFRLLCRQPFSVSSLQWVHNTWQILPGLAGGTFPSNRPFLCLLTRWLVSSSMNSIVSSRRIIWIKRCYKCKIEIIIVRKMRILMRGEW